MAREKVKQVQVFSLPTEYERQTAEARRREMMAEILAQQAYDPGQYQGAPIPKAAPVVKALEGYLRGREMRKAREAGEKAEAEVSRSGQQIMGRLMGGAPIAEPVMPDAFGLDEVRVQSQYRASPDDAMRMAMTPAGSAAMRGNPALAAMLARTMERPEAEEFYAPTETEGGLVQFGKRGGMRETGLKPSPKAPQAVTPTTIVKDGRRVVVDARTGKEIGAAPETSPLVVNYGSPVAGVDEEGNPVFFQPEKSGGAPSIVPGVRPSPKGMNENQAKAAGFADRIAESSPVLDTSPQSVGASILSEVPGGNFALDPSQQMFFQAERNFINAVLRRESGAVISDAEFANARKQYIPQPGDSGPVLEQKRRNRETVLRSLSRDAGPSYQPVIDLPPR
jgi:hypothetical protein